MRALLDARCRLGIFERQPSIIYNERNTACQDKDLSGPYFLTVRKQGGEIIRHRERYETLEEALRIISAEYLTDPTMPYCWSGYFSMRNGEITRLLISRPAAAFYLKAGIASIEVISARGALEFGTHNAVPDS